MSNSIFMDELRNKAVSVLHPGPCGRVPHILLENVSFKDKNGILHTADFIEIRQTGIFYILLRNQFSETDAENILNDIRSLQELLGPNSYVYSVVLSQSMSNHVLGSSNIVNISNFRSFMAQFSSMYYSEDELIQLTVKIGNIMGKPFKPESYNSIPKTTKFKYCSQCGAKIAEYHRVCPHCSHSEYVAKKEEYNPDDDRSLHLFEDRDLMMIYIYNLASQAYFNSIYGEVPGRVYQNPYLK